MRFFISARKFVTVGTELAISYKGRSYRLCIASIVFGNGETVKEQTCEGNNSLPLNKDFRMWERKRFFEVVREMNRPPETLDQQSLSSVCIAKSTKVMWAAEKMQISESPDSLAGYEAQKKEILEFLSTTGLSHDKVQNIV